MQFKIYTFLSLLFFFPQLQAMDNTAHPTVENLNSEARRIEDAVQAMLQFRWTTEELARSQMNETLDTPICINVEGCTFESSALAQSDIFTSLSSPRGKQLFFMDSRHGLWFIASESPDGHCSIPAFNQLRSTLTAVLAQNNEKRIYSPASNMCYTINRDNKDGASVILHRKVNHTDSHGLTGL